ncbi:DEAD/DEAH box helicase [Orenia marismortui]|uniref:ATP-dependent Lhr-like helicase n=1 Tax=Orenia marismortui TaxID=46469 RepID=A0A4V3GXS3_9FIRM|nr:DEAD/DEAH box helicase [Orenia marismortui]TDX49142.1 ATP-dependent Lhr-like helicase [Orenia marismortui]
MSFSLLSEPIQKFIWDEEWKYFTPIQDAAISKIIKTDYNYILASQTASGKTEAAFLPILSLLDSNVKGVQVLYISPLRALINDQFKRVDKLCEYLNMKVTKWHSDVSSNYKNKLIKEPNGILQITPESIESFFLNHPEYIEHLFNNLKFIVIDEIHTFLATPRGIHLQSLLSRLIIGIDSSPRCIGLSATLGEFNEAKKFFGNINKTKVLKASSSNSVKFFLINFKNENKALPIPLVQDCYKLTQKYKSLIFANSRGRTEEIAVKLKKEAQRSNNHNMYFTHHSSIDKKERENIESLLKDSKNPITVACTSTLELGIDIGSIDLVVQLDSTFSVSSLVQRLGRSGRGKDKSSLLQMYTTNEWSMLQAISCIELYKDKFLDFNWDIKYPIDILFHQILSTLMENNGIKRNEIFNRLRNNFAFKVIKDSDINLLLDFMIEKEYIQDLKHELILGYEGENLTNSRKIYSVFDNSFDFKVLASGKNIGTLPYSLMIKEGENIFLGAKIWKIHKVDFKGHKLYVQPANDGKPPLFSGNPGLVPAKVREKMMEIIFSDINFSYINKSAKNNLESLRNDFRHIDLKDITKERPVIKNENHYSLYTFADTRVNRTLYAIFVSLLGNEVVKYNGLDSTLNFRTKLDLENLILTSKKLTKQPHNVLEKLDKDKLSISKWGQYLPEALQNKWLKYNYFDFDKTIEYLNTINFIE